MVQTGLLAAFVRDRSGKVERGFGSEDFPLKQRDKFR